MSSLRDAFELLVDLDAATRVDHLRKLDLPREDQDTLRAMLSADSAERSLVDIPVIELIERLGNENLVSERLVGTMVGSFRILALIGEGGSSVVFRAERAAGTNSQFVALKMLRVGLFSASAERRFRREHEILAQLDHPNIARLIEGGVSDAGIPYIAMELVDGEPITAAANRRMMDMEARLRLFSQLCRSVDTAHAALVIHRDLKPSNIMVDARGDLKILDFGIARLDGADQETARTQTISLTPEYAAPEQFRRGHQTVAVDVFALGILLGELLTGHRTRSHTLSFWATQTKESLPQGLPPRQVLSRKLRGDLDAIARMASEEDPARRYRSADAIAADIDRYLAAQPVFAQRPTAWYHASKFVRRHRASVLLGTAIATIVLSSLASAIVQRLEALRETANARSQLARADSMRDFMFESFAEAEPTKPRNGPATVLDVVHNALVASQNITGSDLPARLELRLRLAYVLQSQGDLEGAHFLLVDLRKQAFGSLESSEPLVASIAWQIADNALARGDYDAARAEINESLSRVNNLSKESQVRFLSLSAVLATKVRDRQRALTDGQQAIALARECCNAEAQRQALNALSVVLLSSNRLPEAASAYEELLVLNRARFGNDHRNLASTQAALSRVYRRMGDLPRAEKAVREALAIDRAIYTDDDAHTALHLNALMIVLRSEGDIAGAMDAAREAYRINRETLGDEHPETANAQYGVGALASMLDDFKTAIPLLRGSLAISEQQFGRAHRETAVARASYGFALAMDGDVKAGTTEIEKAISDIEALAVPDPENWSIAVEKRVKVAIHNDDSVGAMIWIRRLERDSSQVPQASPRWPGNVDTLRGAALLAAHRNGEAVEVLERAGTNIAASTSVDPTLRVQQRLLLANAVLATGDVDRSRQIAIDARQHMRQLPFISKQLIELEKALPQ